ncbi:histidine kinase [Solwaraspora sp. WMMD791]|uniref:sensor histidine kinase n=1 Tax=Solwaraspora sp. WMMD791 TaxID=3016086 RepID=UPI00249B2AD6|nr:histidine kinase [Solwaraspora sp. WMMD791]WFE30064.1 histidine kinase [Solwaraspora sp. WMMD791]
MTDPRGVRQLWRRCDVTVRDLPLALLLALATMVPALDNRGTRLGDLPDRPFDLLAVAVVALQCLPLAGRRRWPGVCLGLVSVGFAIDQLLGYHTVAGTALPIALLSAGIHLGRHRRATLVAVSAAYVLLAVALDQRGSTEGLAGFVTFYLALALAWGAGAWLRTSRAAEAQHRRHVAESTRIAERTRIARELHDVVTHHVTAMVVQAEAARYLTAAPDRLDQTLTTITDTGRRAISDLRNLLDLLDPDHSGTASTSSLRELRTLVERARQAGQPVEFTQEGRPPESAGSAEATSYRVVQEALTNALKYDHGGPTALHVRYDETEITVTVSSAGSGSSAGSPGGAGRGLAGLAERVSLLGGDFDAGRQPGGGFLVRARIPTGSPA